MPGAATLIYVRAATKAEEIVKRVARKAVETLGKMDRDKSRIG